MVRDPFGLGIGNVDIYGLSKKNNRDTRRSFNRTEKTEIWERQHGKCSSCSGRLTPSATHYDHIKPWENGGKTSIDNGQALCANCHSNKSHKDRLKKNTKNKRSPKINNPFALPKMKPMNLGFRDAWK